MTFTMQTNACARDKHRYGLISRLLLPWRQQKAGGHAMEKLMNTHVNRRVVFAASAGLAAGTVAAAATPADLPVMPPDSAARRKEIRALLDRARALLAEETGANWGLFAWPDNGIESPDGPRTIGWFKADSDRLTDEAGILGARLKHGEPCSRTTKNIMNAVAIHAP